MNKTTLHFSDIQIYPQDFNGLSFAQARALIINHACETLMHFYFDCEDEEDCLFNVADAHVDMIAQTVTIETAEIYYN